jgi:transcriptional regulator with XRE-family HTH domain
MRVARAARGSGYVTFGYHNQQLKVTVWNGTVAAMANSDGREAFSKRLRQALQQGGVGVDSPTHLAHEFNDHYPGKRVTQQAVRKWLNGEAIPAHDKIMAFADWLEVGAEWLEYGKGSASAPAPAMQQAAPVYRSSLSDEELLKRYRKLNHSQQRAVAEIISGLAGKDRRR